MTYAGATKIDVDPSCTRSMNAATVGCETRFFLPTMLRHMPFVGIWDDGLLVASAGCHVASDIYGVAAVGAVITRPSHRGKGLGAAVISALCQRIRHRYGTIGLNVSAENAGALRLYQRLGFRQAFTYEEIELL